MKTAATVASEHPRLHTGEHWALDMAALLPAAAPHRWIGIFTLLLAMLCCYNSAAYGQAPAHNPATAPGLAARNILFSKVSPQQGLSQGTINAIAQDPQGLIWFGTQEGLNRYDGYDVVVYEHRHDDTNSLSHDWVWSLYVDNAGTLWAGTDGGGLNRYERDSDSFTHFRQVPGDPDSLSNDRVRVVYQDSKGFYWIGTDGGGLNRLDASTGRFTHYRHDPSSPYTLPSDKVLAIFEDSRGKLWVGTEAGLARMDHAQEQFVVYRHDPSVADSLSDDQVRSIYEDRRGQLWIGTYRGGLNRYDRNSNSFRHFRYSAENSGSLSNDRVRSIYEDRAGTLWIATDKGLNEWRPDSESFIRYQHDPLQPGSLSDNRVTVLFQDAGDVLWVGTFNGVNKWNYVSDVFRHLHVRSDDPARLSGNVITAIEESAGGEVWVGTYGGGVNRIDLATGHATQFRHAPTDPTSLSDDRVMALFAAPDAAVWVGTRSGGLNRFDPTSGRFTRYRHDPADPGSLSSDSISALASDESGLIWIGTYGAGLNRLDPDTGRFRAYRHDPGNSMTLSSDRILSLYRDRSGVLWVGTEDGGINRFDENTQSFTRYQEQLDDPSSLSSNAVLNITESKDGSLWLATLGGGLNRWERDDRAADRPVFRHYQKNDGLRSDTVFGILEDQDGFLWISSNRGLSRLNPRDGALRHFDRFNGLRSDEFNFGAHLKTAAGRLLFGGTDGLVSFDPDLLRVNMHRPDLMLNAHSRYQKLATTYSADSEEPGTLVLDYKDDYIMFEFSALDYTSSDKNRYRYKLEGFDEDWVDPGQVRRATYTSLPAGDYTFTVTASNNDGVWNEQGVSLRLRVEPPPWQTPWAYSLYTVFIGGTLVNYRRTQNLKLDRAAKQSAKLERQVQARTRELSLRNEQLKELNDKLLEASTTDSLTGLKNRRYLYDSIESRVALAERRVAGSRTDGDSNTVGIAPSLFFMMIDLDGFKAINDSFGHLAGDQALLQVRDVLQSTCRKADTIIRWGGDEFMIIGENTSARAAEQLAERIRASLAERQYQLGGGHVGRLSGSIGFVMYPFSPLNPKAFSWEQAVAVADHAAYTAKKNGRDAWVGVYGTRKSAWDEFSKSRMNIESLYGQGMIEIRSSLKEIPQALGRDRQEEIH